MELAHLTRLRRRRLISVFVSLLTELKWGCGTAAAINMALLPELNPASAWQHC